MAVKTINHNHTPQTSATDSEISVRELDNGGTITVVRPKLGSPNVIRYEIPPNTTSLISISDDVTELTADDLFGIGVISHKVNKSAGNLKRIEIPRGTQVKSYAFTRIDSLTKVVLHPGAHVDDMAFNMCKNLSIVEFSGAVLPNDTFIITSIGEDAFSCCASLTHVVRKGPSDSRYLVRLKQNAFRVKSVEFPRLENDEVNISAFAKCPALKRLYFVAYGSDLFNCDIFSITSTTSETKLSPGAEIFVCVNGNKLKSIDPSGCEGSLVITAYPGFSVDIDKFISTDYFRKFNERVRTHHLIDNHVPKRYASKVDQDNISVVKILGLADQNGNIIPPQSIISQS